MTDTERRAVVNRALQAMGNRNRVTLTAGMSRQEANAALRRAAAGEGPELQEPPVEPERAAGGSLDGGVQGALVEADPHAAVNAALRTMITRGY